MSPLLSVKILFSHKAPLLTTKGWQSQCFLSRLTGWFFHTLNRQVLLIIATTCFVTSGVGAQTTLYLAGDSTCAAKLDQKRPETGWGEMMQQYFDPAKVVIDNHAQNGRSTKTFISEGRWQAIIDKLKKGDWVFVQFGHNDESKEKGERYTSPDQFRANLVRFVDDVRAKRANIVLLTPVMRRKFDKNGNFVDQHPPEYPDAMREIAKQKSIPLIDMHRKSEALIKSYGVEGSRVLFLQLKPGENLNYPNGIEDNTHFVPKGAEEMAKLVVDGIREGNLKLKKYLKK